LRGALNKSSSCSFQAEFCARSVPTSSLCLAASSSPRFFSRDSMALGSVENYRCPVPYRIPGEN